MYITVLVPRKRMSPYELHVALTKALKAPVGRLLFVEERGLVVAQTEKPPQFGKGLFLPGPSVPLLPPRKGERLPFRLKALPAVRREGRIVWVSRDEAGALSWLEKRAQARGFRLLRARVFPLPPVEGKDGVKHLPVLFRGTLEVTDEALFREALTRGLGPGKYLGLGLLLLEGGRDERP